jgi:hypothetical protein
MKIIHIGVLAAIFAASALPAPAQTTQMIPTKPTPAHQFNRHPPAIPRSLDDYRRKPGARREPRHAARYWQIPGPGDFQEPSIQV